MSQSLLHQHFKSLTAMTPLQFQKQLRLLEARRLMVADAASVAQAAHQVGYESPVPVQPGVFPHLRRRAETGRDESGPPLCHLCQPQDASGLADRCARFT